MRRGVGFAAAVLGVCLTILAGILATVHWVGTDSGLYYELQMEADILEYAGISGEELARLDEALADCLRGNGGALYDEPDLPGADRPAISATVFGEEQPAFNDRELTHMEDCRRLFALLRRVLWSAAIAGPLLGALGAYLCRDWRRVRLAGWIGLAALLAPLGAFAAWAAADFNSAFNFFHRLLFTNELWLLDPRTDLLIRICPASMFMRMGARIGVVGLAWMLLVPMLTSIPAAVKKEKR